MVPQLLDDEDADLRSVRVAVSVRTSPARPLVRPKIRRSDLQSWKSQRLRGRLIDDRYCRGNVGSAGTFKSTIRSRPDNAWVCLTSCAMLISLPNSKNLPALASMRL